MNYISTREKRWQQSKFRRICVDNWPEGHIPVLEYPHLWCKQVFGHWLHVRISDLESKPRQQLLFRLFTLLIRCSLTSAVADLVVSRVLQERLLLKLSICRLVGAVKELCHTIRSWRKHQLFHKADGGDNWSRIQRPQLSSRLLPICLIAPWQIVYLAVCDVLPEW